ncbi:MAG: IPT/TIG domain-containing protein [Deltaproteobacteria bacterium]|nr:IPT/TIG domain-containing protein [Deltaproteobacteria bacterium]
MRRHPLQATVLLLVALSTWACKGPPQLAPSPGITSVAPGVACTAQLTSTVRVDGSNLFLLPADAIVDDGAERPPALRLERTVDLAGEAAAGSVDLSDPEVPGDVRWLGRTAMEFDVVPDAAVPVGLHDLVLQNLAGQQAREDDALLAVPPPTLASQVPDLVCTAQFPNSITLSGAGFLVVDGTLPTADLGGVTLTPDGATGCAPLPGAVPVESCSTLDLTLPQDALGPGIHTTVVTNPSPAACQTTEAVTFEVVPPPSVLGVEPALVCGEQLDNALTITGAGFLEIDGTLPTVTLGPWSGTADAATDCDDLLGPAGGRSCAELTVTIPAGSLAPGVHPLTVTNPAPADCLTTDQVFVEVVPPPALAEVSPDPFCEDPTGAAFTLTGSSFLVMEDGTLPTVDFGGFAAEADSATGCTDLLGPVTAQTCTELSFTLPQGVVPSGVHEVFVTNAAPAACESSPAVSVELLPTPFVVSLDPPAGCSDETSTQLTIEGMGFFASGGAVPTVTIGGMGLAGVVASNCVAASGTTGGEECTTLQVTVPNDLLGLGIHPLVVTNPAPSSCASGGGDTYAVADPPFVDSLDPAQVCATGTIEIQGSGFLPTASVTIGGLPAASVTYQSDTSLLVEVPAGLGVGFHDVIVDNGTDCAATYSSLEVTGFPSLFYVDPPVVYDDLSFELTYFVSGISGTVVDAWVEEVATGTLTPLAYTFDPTNPSLVQVTLPSGFLEGDYDAGIIDSVGCEGLLPGAVFVESDLEVDVDAVDPPFGWTDAYTPVAVTANDPPAAGMVGFTDVPRVYLNPTSTTATATALSGASFVDGSLLNAAVPLGLDPDVYDVLVVNPDGTIGLVPAGFEVTAAQPPVIETVAPGTVATNEDAAVTILGSEFDQPTASMLCDVPGTGVVTYSVQVTSWTADSIDAVLQASTLGIPQSLCIVRVTNTTTGTYGDYSAVSVGNPSGNLGGFSFGTPMGTARIAPAAAAGRATTVSRTLFALGGEDSSGAPLDSVESVDIDAYGGMGPQWTPLAPLPLPLTQARAVDLDDRFVYVLGGHDGVSAVDTTYRAQVLDPLEAPTFDGLIMELGNGSNLVGGAWIYRIAATYGPSDPANPSGESLPGNPVVVNVPVLTETIVVTLSWDPVPEASGYRIYRTPTAGTGTGSEEWIADVTGQTTFTDDGLARFHTKCRELSPGARLISLTHPPEAPRLVPVAMDVLDFSWGPATVFVHRMTAPAGDTLSR